MTISRPSATTPPATPETPADPAAPPTPQRRAQERAEQRAERRVERLAEMVAELTGCGPEGALDAVRASFGGADPLETVARAMIAVEDPESDRFRVTGYLRPRPPARRNARRPGAGPRVEPPRPHPSVVPAAPEPAAEPATAEVALSTSADLDDTWPDDVIMDLRVDEPQVHIDLTMMDRMARVRRAYRRR